MNQNRIEMVNQVLITQFEIPLDKLKPEALLKEDLGLDSLDFVDMIVVFEDKIQGKLTHIDFFKIKTLQDIYNLADSAKTSDSH
jgi:acyl carrier protein